MKTGNTEEYTYLNRLNMDAQHVFSDDEHCEKYTLLHRAAQADPVGPLAASTLPLCH